MAKLSVQETLENGDQSVPNGNGGQEGSGDSDDDKMFQACSDQCKNIVTNYALVDTA